MMSPDQSEPSSPTSSDGEHGRSFTPTTLSLREWVLASSVTILLDEPSVHEARVRLQLRQEVVLLWKRAWLGIYRLDGLDGLSHSYCLRRFYIRAGLEIDLWESPIEQGSARTREYGWNSGIYYLKLYDNISISTLRSVVNLLKDYETQVAAVNRAYDLLETHQEEDEDVDSMRGIRFSIPMPELQHEWCRLSASLRDNLWQLQLRMGVLNQMIFDEAMRLHRENPTTILDGWFVRDRAFPTRRR